MRETVGLRSAAAVFHPQLIKRDALMFRRIGINGCDKLHKFEDELSEAQLDVLWLIEQGIVFDSRYDFDNALASADEATRKSLGITASQVSLLIRQGKLPAEKHGRDWLVKESDLKNFERTPVGRPPSKKSGGKSK